MSRLILGGNLLTHYTHSRDLKYVYSLAAHYNTDEKILETLAKAEAAGINTVSMHNPEHPISLLRRYRKERGGKIQWIICPTAPVEPDMIKYREHVESLVKDGCEAIYLWGVHADSLVAQGKFDLVAKAVELPKEFGVPSGVGGHSLDVVKACEEHGVKADFYIKTFHSHNYPTAPKPEEINEALQRIPRLLVQQPGRDRQVHEDGEQALDCLQDHGGGRHSTQDRLPLRLPPRRGLCAGGHVRLRDRRRRQARDRGPGPHQRPRAGVERLSGRSGRLANSMSKNILGFSLLLGAALLAPAARRRTARSAKTNAFFAFCIDTHDAKKRNLEQQAALLKELGYDGVGHLWLDNIPERLKTLDAAGLKLFQITMTVDIAPGKQAYDPRFKEVMPLLKGRGVQFVLLMNGLKPSDPAGDARAVEIVREMADLARDSGAQVLLYPHSYDWLERIEDAVRVADKVDRPNVGVMFNLCHWLRVSKRPRLQAAAGPGDAPALGGLNQWRGRV